ncbi:MAG: hypothetical protein CVU39_01945 [Chloroflexi bacterium HGW-Chloroflexi-10]|nr:MAG: hypothetical protein CVU39_01945 [Chloroflexi bacterium HGW-Chloroflexi-10]
MNLPVINIEHVSKKYLIGDSQPRYRTLRDSISNSIKSILQNSKNKKSEFWALDDISFKIYPGEVIGIIGKNGAGKSTLLKILAHITNPSKGIVELNGRVGSLLEVGTGFHPELSGRENIYLNGAILGMKKAEIDRKFDEIVDFAEIEKFLETPAKHYSSGMYMRLAFAVAAHLEPEILLVDEVLAVGDATFQQKCLGKMGEIANKGLTVLFVSHNLAAVSKLCPTSILLNKGKVDIISSSNEVIRKYLDNISTPTGSWDDRVGTGRARITKIEIRNIENQISINLAMGQPFVIYVEGVTTSNQVSFSAGLQIVSEDGVNIIYGHDQYTLICGNEENKFFFKISINDLLLMPGNYYINLWLGKSGIEEFDYIKGAARITVFQGENLPVSHTIDNSLGLIFTRMAVEVEN